MVTRPRRFAFAFAIALGIVVTILAITWAATPHSESESGALIPLTETIYRPQHWNLF